MPEVKLIATIGGDFRLIESFIKHYQNIGCRNIIFAIHLRSENETGDVSFQGLTRLIEAHGATIGSIWIEQGLNHARRYRERNKLISEYCHREDWVINADLDEFQLYPRGFEQTLSLCEAHGYHFILSPLIDRFAKGGALAELDDSDLWGQFPLAGRITAPLLKGNENKVALSRAFVALSPGQHSPLSNEATICPFGSELVQIHHFKWDAEIVGRLEQRIAKMKEENANWWQESQRFLCHIRENGGCVNVHDPNYQFKWVADNLY